MVWSLWLKEQQKWLAVDSEYWLKRLASHDAAVSAEAIRTLSKRRYGREKIALAVGRILEAGQREVKPLACLALMELGSKAAVPALLEVLDHEETELAEAAWRALRALTGKDLPLDHTAWRSALSRG
jgi:HEAT repeat protein